MTDTSPPSLRTADAARFLDRSPATLRSWRLRGGGPPFHGIPGSGGCIIYRVADLVAWKAEQEKETPNHE